MCGTACAVTALWPLNMQVLYELPAGIVVPQLAAAALSSSEEDTRAEKHGNSREEC